MKNEDTSLTSKKWTSKDYSEIEQMEKFNHFVRKKNRFLFSVTITFLIFYILLPILAFTPILQQKVIGNITGVWIYSAGLFVMTVVLCTLYIKKANSFDKQAAEVMEDYKSRGENK